MVITATEAKANFGKYLLLSAMEDIFITKNGKVVSKMTKPAVDKDSLLDSLVGIIPSEYGDMDIKEERLAKQ